MAAGGGEQPHERYSRYSSPSGGNGAGVALAVALGIAVVVYVGWKFVFPVVRRFFVD